MTTAADSRHAPLPTHDVPAHDAAFHPGAWRNVTTPETTAGEPVYLTPARWAAAKSAMWGEEIPVSRQLTVDGQHNAVCLSVGCRLSTTHPDS